MDKENKFADFPPIGGLMVSKMVAVDRRKPMFMYREKRNGPEDSGWRIFSGLENQEYTDDPENTGIYAASTILEIDPSIADILLKGVGSVFERVSEHTDWYAVDNFELDEDYMIILPLTKKWQMMINNLFEFEREESGDLYFTTGDKSVRLAIWNSDKSRAELSEEHAEIVKQKSSADVLDTFDLSDESCTRIGYSIKESDGSKTYHVIYAFTIVDQQVVQLAFYFDNKDDIDWAVETWENLKLREISDEE